MVVTWLINKSENSHTFLPLLRQKNQAQATEPVKKKRLIILHNRYSRLLTLSWSSFCPRLNFGGIFSYCNYFTNFNNNYISSAHFLQLSSQMQRTLLKFCIKFNYFMVRPVSSGSGSQLPILTLFTKRNVNALYITNI